MAETQNNQDFAGTPDAIVVENEFTELDKTEPVKDTADISIVDTDPVEVEKTDPKDDEISIVDDGPSIMEDNRYEGLDVEDYTDYLGSTIFMPTGGVEELNRRRGELQSGWQQAGNMIGQAVVGEIIGGTVEGLGYLLDLGSVMDYMTGNETEWGNFMTDAGKGLRTWGQDAMAIHQKAPGKFDPSDSGWWFSNGVSVASTLSMLIPSMAATKALGFLGKGASKLGGKFSRVLDVAENMGKKSTWMTEGISQAVVSRHIENSMEASGTFESKREELLNKIDKETGLPFTEEKATQIASTAASDNYNKGWAMLLQDIPQYLALGKIFNPHTSRMENALSKASSRGLGVKMKPWMQKVSGGVGTFVSEGAEESYQYLIAENAKAMADLNAGIITREKYDEIMEDAMGSDEMKTSAFFGGLGGNLFHFAGKGLSELKKGKKKRTFEKEYEKTYATTLNDRARNFMSMQQKLSDADNNNNLEAREMVLDEMMLMMTTDSLHRGKFDQHIEALEGIASMTKEEAAALKEQGGSDFNLELAKKNIPSVIKKSEEMRMDYLKFSNKYDANIAAKMAQNNYRTKRFVENSAKMDEKIQKVTYGVPNASAISTTQMEKIEGLMKVKALTQMNETFKKQLEQEGVSELRKPHIEKLIKDNEKRIAKMTLDYQAIKGDDPRDAEQKRKDARLAQGFDEDVTAELTEAYMIKERNNAEISLNQSENGDIRKESYRKGLKKQELTHRVNTPLETEEQGQELQKEIEESDFLTKDEKIKNAAVVNENIEELANEEAVAREYANDDAREAERLAEEAARSANTTTVSNANKASVADNIEDEHAEDSTNVTKTTKSQEKGKDRAINTDKVSSNIKVPLYANLNGPGWKDWVFNGKDKTGAKDGKPVLLDYVVGTPGGIHSKLGQQAIEIFNKAKKNPKIKLTAEEKDILFNHLPIKIQLTDDIWSHIPAYSKTNAFYKTNELPKRENIIRQMFLGNTQTQVTHQFGGNLNVQEIKEENGAIPENNVMQFPFINGSMGKVDLMVTNEHGTLVRASDKSDHPDFEGLQIDVIGVQDDNTNPVPYKGGVFLNIPKANGDPFPLKLNLRKPNIAESTFVADILIAIMLKKIGKEALLSSDADLFKTFKEDHPNEFAVLGKDAKVMDVAKLFVHMTSETAGKATHLHLSGEWIRYGLDPDTEGGFKGIVTPDNVGDNREALIGFIMNEKRRQLNLNQWNHGSYGAKYREMMLNTVISTDAVVGSENTTFSENETIGRENELGAFKSDIMFKVPDGTPEATKVVPKNPTAVNKKVSEREALSNKAGVVNEREKGFAGVFFDKQRNRIPVYGKNEAHVKELIKARYDAERLDAPAQKAATVIKEVPDSETDESLYERAKKIVIDAASASASLIQRKLQIGYEQAGRIMDLLEKRGIVSKFDGAKGRTVVGNLDVANDARDSELDKFKKAKEDRAKVEIDKIEAERKAELKQYPYYIIVKDSDASMPNSKHYSLMSTSDNHRPDTTPTYSSLEAGNFSYEPKFSPYLKNKEEFNKAISSKTIKKINEINTKYDAKIAALEPTQQTSGVVKESPEYEGFDESFDGFAAERAKSNEPISNDIWKKFVDNGTVSKMQLNKIANKIMSNDLLSTREKAIFTDKTAEVNKILVDLKAKDEVIARNKMAEREMKIKQTNIEFESANEAKQAEEISKERKIKEEDPNKDEGFTEQGEWDCIL